MKNANDNKTVDWVGGSNAIHGNEVTEKQLESQKLSVDIAEWMLTGGRVKTLPGVVYKEKPSVVIEPRKFITEMQQKALIRWANGNGVMSPLRRNAISEITGIPLRRVRNQLITTSSSRVRVEEYELIKDAIKQIEAREIGAAA